MAAPGELESLIEQALRDDVAYQALLRQLNKQEPGTKQGEYGIKRLRYSLNNRKEIIIAQVRAQNPDARKRGGMIHPFGRGYKTNKL